MPASTWPSGVPALSPARPCGVDSDAARTNSKFHFRYLLVLFGYCWSSPREPGLSRKIGPRKKWPETVKKRSNFMTQDRHLRKLTKSAVKFSSPVAGRWVSTLNEQCPSPLAPFSKYSISWSGLVPVWCRFGLVSKFADALWWTLLVQKRSGYEPSTTTGT